MTEDIRPTEMAHGGIKWVLKQFLRRFGFDIVRHDPASYRPLNVLDFVVECAAARNKEFYFVQVGANDGVRHDPLRALTLRFGLSGLLIEPLPDLFEDLRRNYAGVPGLAFENVALSRSSGDLRLARFRRDAPIHDDLHSIASADVARLRRFAQRRGIAHFLEELHVPCVSARELFDRHGVEHIDLLQLDVEGFELEIVMSVLDTGLLPTIINMEHLHLSPSDRIRAQRIFVERGYSYVYTGIDMLAVLPREQWRCTDGAGADAGKAG